MGQFSTTELLNELCNSGIESTLCFKSGVFLKGTLERPEVLSQKIGFVLRSTDPHSPVKFHLFFPESVDFISFSEMASLESLFSNKKFDRRKATPPTLIDLKRQLVHATEFLAPMTVTMESAHASTDELRWKLHDFIESLAAAFAEIQKDKMGQLALKDVKSLKLQAEPGTSFKITKLNADWVLHLDIEALKGSVLQKESLVRFLEAQL